MVDARTDVTTQLLSDKGFIVSYTDDETGEAQEEAYKQREFEKAFFSEATNVLFCKTFMANALRDAVSGEFAKFVADCQPEAAGDILAIKTYFKAYITSDQIRHIMDGGRYTALVTNPVFSLDDLRLVPEEYLTIVSDYVKDYVSLNQFSA